MGRRSDEGRFTLAYCEELLRQNPTATAGIYHRVRKELREMEAKEAGQIHEATPTDVLAAVNVSVNRESSHRWDVRAALLDGPKTAQQCANWARERGNQHIDRPLAENILRNLIRNEEVGVDCTVNAGKPTVFVATDNMKRPPEQPIGQPAFPLVDPPPAPGRVTLDQVQAQCVRILPGGTLTADIPEGVPARDFAQSVRVRLACGRVTKPYSWSVNQLPNGQLLITSRGLKQQPPESHAAPGGRFEIGAPNDWCSSGCLATPIATIDIPVRTEPPQPVTSAPSGDVALAGPLPLESEENAAPTQRTSKTIQLRSGGTVSLIAEVDLFSLSAKDRWFVCGMRDMLEEYLGETP